MSTISTEYGELETRSEITDKGVRITLTLHSNILAVEHGQRGPTIYRRPTQQPTKEISMLELLLPILEEPKP